MTRTDIRCLWVGMVRHPWGVLAAILSLALGCALNVGVYRVLDSVFNAPLPFATESRLALVGLVEKGEVRYGLTGRDVAAIREVQGVFDDLAVLERYPPSPRGMAVVRQEGRLVRVAVGRLVGVSASSGRVLNPRDAVGSNLAVLSRRAAVRFFGTLSPLGRTLTLGEMVVTVIGVLPEAFVSPVPATETLPLVGEVDIWLQGEPEDPGGRAYRYNLLVRTNGDLNAAGQRARAVAVCAAMARAGIEQEGCIVAPLRDAMLGGQGRRLKMLQGLCLLLLAISVANVVSILVLRSLRHRTQIAVRWAFGASRRHMWQVPFLEVVALSVGGAASGAVFGWWTLGALSSLLWNRHWHQSGEVLLWAGLAVGCVTMVSIACGLIAVVRTVDAERLRGALAEHGTAGAGRPGIGPQRWVVRVQTVALLSLVAPALATGTALLELTRHAPILARTDLVVADGLVIRPGLEEDSVIRRRQDDLERLARQIPGVADVALSSDIPVQSLFPTFRVWLPGRQGAVRTFGAALGSGYFSVLGVRFLSGRDFRASDSAEAPRVAIVSRTFAEKAFRRIGVVGEVIDWHGLRTIVGVVEDHGFGEEIGLPRSSVFVPRYESVPGRVCLFIRLNGQVPRDIVMERLSNLDPEQPFDLVAPLDALARRNFPRQSAYVVWAAVLGLAGLPIAFVGTGVAAGFAVRMRRTELAARRAFGAVTADIVSFAVQQQLRVVVPAAVAALPVQIWLCRLAQSSVLPLKIATWWALVGTTTAIVLCSCVIAATAAALECRGEVSHRLRGLP
jgi:putative ABC transport system permease protein